MIEQTVFQYGFDALPKMLTWLKMIQWVWVKHWPKSGNHDTSYTSELEQ